MQCTSFSSVPDGLLEISEAREPNSRLPLSPQQRPDVLQVRFGSATWNRNLSSSGSTQRFGCCGSYSAHTTLPYLLQNESSKLAASCQNRYKSKESGATWGRRFSSESFGFGRLLLDSSCRLFLRALVCWALLLAVYTCTWVYSSSVVSPGCEALLPSCSSDEEPDVWRGEITR